MTGARRNRTRTMTRTEREARAARRAGAIVGVLGLALAVLCLVPVACDPALSFENMRGLCTVAVFAAMAGAVGAFAALEVR